MVLDETLLPVAPAVTGACDLLGIDPLYVANEGKVVAVVAPDEADAALAALRAHPLGTGATRIGEIAAEPEGIVVLLTAFGGTRIVDMLVGDPLPADLLRRWPLPRPSVRADPDVAAGDRHGAGGRVPALRLPARGGARARPASSSTTARAC